ncbi:MAG: ATP-binding cassette subfamily B protein AbcA/BmrA [Lysobacterales bacterium]|jgi:ATP-binding cassette subfamily B protein AbcA/BmrA
MSHPLLNNHPVFRDITRRFHAPILIATLIMALSSVLALGFPLALKNMVEQYTANAPYLNWALGGGALLVISLVLRAFGSLRATMVAEKLKAALRLSLYRKFLGKDLAFHREHGPGHLMSVLYSDIDQLSSVYTNLLPSGISSVLILVGSSIALARLDFKLAVVLFASAALVFVLTRLSYRRIREMGKSLHEAFSQLYKAVTETLRQIMIIKTNRLTDWASERLEKEQTEIVELNIKLRFYYGLMSILVQALLATALLGGWVLLTRSTAQESLGTQLSTLLYGLLLVRQVGNCAGLVAQFRQAQGAMDRLDELLGAAQSSGQRFSEQPGPLNRLDIRDLDFFYDGKQVLKQLKVSVQKGERIAIIGANGAGKTTLLNLLVCLEQPPASSIFWNDVDLNNFNPDELHRRVAYLPQDSLLNQATIAQNLRMGNLETSDDELWKAAEQAGVAEIIRQQENGMDTLLGSEGSRLSGGEKRRLALARLLICKDAELYLLDEPTEGLDPEAEQHILTTALSALEGKTVILITHRAAVLERVDRVWRMENGRLFL